jgi:hypothetical protein
MIYSCVVVWEQDEARIEKIVIKAMGVATTVLF